MEETITQIKPESLIMEKNSRFRIQSDLSELMESIKQNGILQSIVARTEDKHVICGNRRLSAAIKLDLNTVPVIFKEGIDDKNLLILNLLENIQRKNISSIEIGKQVYEMTKSKEFHISTKEIGVALGLPMTRITNCLAAYTKLPVKFREKVVYSTNPAMRKEGELPENVMMAVLNFGRFWKSINSEEMEYLMDKVAEDKISITQINLVGSLYAHGMPFKKAIKELNSYKVMRINLIALRTELGTAMKTEGKNNQFERSEEVV